MLEGLELIGNLPIIGQLESIQRTIDLVVTITSVITGVLALLQCFFGYRLLRFWVTVIGALIGFAAGFGITMSVTGGDRIPIAIVVGIVGAILIGLLSFKLYLVGVFLFCGLLAAGAVLGLLYARSSVLAIILAVAAFILAGILSVKFQRLVIIVITAVTGAINAVAAFGRVIPELAFGGQTSLIAILILVVLGMLVQFTTTRDKKKRH